MTEISRKKSYEFPYTWSIFPLIDVDFTGALFLLVAPSIIMAISCFQQV